LGDLYSTIYCTAFIAIFIVSVAGLFLSDYISYYLFGDVKYSDLISIVFVANFFSSFIDLFMLRYRLQRKLKTYVFYSAMRLLSIVGLNVLLVYVLRGGLRGVYESSLISFIVLCIVLFLANVRNIRLKISTSIFKRVLRYCLPTLAIPLLEWARVYFFQLYAMQEFGLESFGILSLSIRFMQIMIFIDYAMIMAWQPMMVKSIGQDNSHHLYRAYYKYSMIAYLLLYAVMVLYSKELLILFATRDYYAAYKYVGLVLMMPLGRALYNNYVNGITISEKTIYRTIAYVIGVAVNIISVMLFAKIWGIYGCIIGSVVGVLAIAFSTLYFAERLCRIGYTKKIVISMLVMCIGITIINAHLGWRNEIDFSFIVLKACIILMLCVVGWYYLLESDERFKIWNAISSKVIKRSYMIRKSVKDEVV
jgi:O-antigen/teichoic acid export membrane protein